MGDKNKGSTEAPTQKTQVRVYADQSAGISQVDVTHKTAQLIGTIFNSPYISTSTPASMVNHTTHAGVELKRNFPNGGSVTCDLSAQHSHSAAVTTNNSLTTVTSSNTVIPGETTQEPKGKTLAETDFSGIRTGVLFDYGNHGKASLIVGARVVAGVVNARNNAPQPNFTEQNHSSSNAYGLGFTLGIQQTKYIPGVKFDHDRMSGTNNTISSTLSAFKSVDILKHKAQLTVEAGLNWNSANVYMYNPDISTFSSTEIEPSHGLQPRPAVKVGVNVPLTPGRR